MPDVAMDQIRSAFAGRACPEVDIAIGDVSRELPRMLSRCEADLAFVGPGQALSGVLARRLASHVDKSPCPVVCVDGASAQFTGWKFQGNAAPAEKGLSLHERAVAS
jgi:hypothetical protein